MENIERGTRKARKDHKCDWCEQTIKAGTEYNFQVNKFDGQVYDFKNHKHCSKLFTELDMCNIDDGDGVGSEAFLAEVDLYLEKNLTEDDYEAIENQVIKACEMFGIEVG